MFAAHALCLEHGFYLPAGITGIKLIHDVQKRGHITVPFGGVYIVVNGNQPHSPLAENFHHLTNFQIVTPQAAHVLDDDRLHVARLDLLHHGGEAGSVETSSRNTVISKMGWIRKTIPAGIVL